MLSRLSDAVVRWEASTRHPAYRAAGVGIGLGAAALVLALPTPEGLTLEAHRTAAVGTLMALWWVGNVLPMAVTALVPLVAFPLLGVVTVKEAAAPFAHPLNFLMLGGFLMAAGMERVGLHRRLSAMVLAPAAVRRSPRRVVFALMVVTAFLSGLVSNTATTVMMLPLALSLGRLCSDDPRAPAGFALALAYAASVGGVSTLVGTPPNAVFAGLAGPQGIDVGFAQWMVLGVPFVVVALPIVWFVVTRVAIPAPSPDMPALQAPEMPAWAPGERAVLGIVGAAMLLWLTRATIDMGPMSFPGWGGWFTSRGSELDAMVAVAAGCAVFLVPRRTDRGWELLLDWPTAQRAVPWSVILLLGGGFSLAATIEGTGLTTWLAQSADAAAGLPMPLTTLLVALGMTFTTELTSNTASTQIALPLLAAAAARAGVPPAPWMVAATLSASCAFMMPVATPPNAIAAEAGGVTPGDMALAGCVLNVTLAFVVTTLVLSVVPWLFGGGG